jgi:hypothetical protein
MEQSNWFKRPEAIWWLICGALAVVIVLVFARRLMG